MRVRSPGVVLVQIEFRLLEDKWRVGVIVWIVSECVAWFDASQVPPLSRVSITDIYAEEENAYHCVRCCLFYMDSIGICGFPKENMVSEKSSKGEAGVIPVIW